MPIDIVEAQKFFNEYVKNYDYQNKKIRRKIIHTENVLQISKKLATELHLNKEDIELASLIGLLHDIGRFEQVKNYNTFIDSKSINHGEYGVKILFEDGLIRKFVKTSEFDDIIRKAILNHNRARIEEGLSDRELLHSKIIRDADKLDILNTLTFEEKIVAYEKEDFSDEIISDEIYRDFMEKHIINYANMRTSADILVAHFAYIFDLYFKPSLAIVKNNRYIESIYARFSFKDEVTRRKFENIYKQALQYLEENAQ